MVEARSRRSTAAVVPRLMAKGTALVSGNRRKAQPCQRRTDLQMTQTPVSDTEKASPFRRPLGRPPTDRYASVSNATTPTQGGQLQVPPSAAR